MSCNKYDAELLIRHTVVDKAAVNLYNGYE